MCVNMSAITARRTMANVQHNMKARDYTRMQVELYEAEGYENLW